uniref:NB-ARC domain-containing protein n=1 Tax=Brassica oleracea var. oleracea TaxID=109376 RepID=A0A0D3BV25_BRAOL
MDNVKLTAETLLLFGVEKLWDLIVRESERLKGVDEQFTELKKLGKASGIRKHMRRLAFSIVDCMEHATEMRGSSKRISKVILSMQSFGLQQNISGDGYSQPLQERREMQKTFSNDNENNLVGLEQNVKTLVHYLVEEDCIRVISITRMGGIGKTTIARQVFNHETVKNHFEGLAWVCVSQQFTRKDVWRTILRNLQPYYEEITEDEIQNKLFGLMETQNYLIVHDDIWKEEDWDRIKPFFFIKLGVSQTYGRTQTNLQVEVQLTDRPSLRVCKWALKHGSISVWCPETS